MAKKEDKPLSPEEEAAQKVKIAGLTEALHDYDVFVQAQAATIWQYDEIPVEGLNLEEQLFVRSYIIDRNPIAALRRLGHAHEDGRKLKARAQRFLAKVEVAEAIEYLGKRMMEKLDITAERIQRQMAAVAFFDPREIMTFDQHGVQMVHSRFWTAEQAACIKKVKMGANGIEIELYDRMRASEMLAKQIGLQPDESDAAQQARMAADEAMTRIGGVFSKLLPGGAEFLEQKLAERKKQAN